MVALATRNEVAEGKYLIFESGNEEFGVEIIKVKEIIGFIDIRTVPRSPEYIKGTINLRGRVIPIIDLRLRFSMPEAKYTQDTCIIVVGANACLPAGQGRSPLHGAYSEQIGIIVDSVSEVLKIKSKEIEEAPHFERSIDTTFIMGLGKTKGKIIILLDIERILSLEDFQMVEQLSENY